MEWLFTALPFLILMGIGVTGLVLLLIDARDRIESILDDELEPSNVVDFPTRHGDSDGVA